MVIGECVKGMRVVAPADGDDVGVIELVDREDGVVWVRFPVPGADRRTDLIDMDPADLAVA